MEESAWMAFQSHRHDVQNYLQLIKGYLQLERPAKAADAVNDCAHWLASLSQLQSKLPLEAQDIFWVAAQCSHLRVSLQSFSQRINSASLCAALKWVEATAVEQNIKYISVTIGLTGSELAIPMTTSECTGETHGSKDRRSACWLLSLSDAHQTLMESFGNEQHGWQEEVEFVW